MSKLKNMRDELILEIEQRVMTLTHAQVGKGSFHLVSCDQIDIRSLRTADVCQGVENLLARVACGDRRIHVVLGDRRFVHRELETPRLIAHELEAFVRREVLRESKLDGTSQILSHCRVLRSEGTAKLICGVVALPLEVWQPVQAGLLRAGVTVVSLSSVEDAATAICDQGEVKHLAILDIAGRGARFVQAEDGVVVRVRRFPLPGVDVDNEDPSCTTDTSDKTSTAAHLAVEIRRTLDHFQSAGLAAPDLLVLSHHVEEGAELIDRVTGDVPFTEWFQLESNLCERGLTPGLAALGTIRRLANSNQHDLLARSVIRVPLSRFRTALTLIAAVVTVVLGTASAWLDHRMTSLSYERDLLADQAGILEQSGSEDRAVRAAETAARERLDGVLRLRRPYSLAVSVICNAVPESMSLNELTLNDSGVLMIEGSVRESSSLRALEIISEFSSQLRALPYLRPPEESVDEDKEGEVVHFRLRTRWSQS